MQVLESEHKLGSVIPNIATLLERNAQRFSGKVVYQERSGDSYSGITWEQLYRNVKSIAASLAAIGFAPGDKMVIFSPNRREMLEMELALMSSRGISVPIFAYFIQDTAELLIKHSDAKYLAVAGSLQLSRISEGLPLKKIIVFDNGVTDTRFKNLLPYSALLENGNSNIGLAFDASSDDICLNMYTSGTMGTPKCVQLSHANILSQQAGLEKVWNISEDDRFLSYLPWHHSFGGLFERFSALYNGATISLESGYGKDAETIMENWKLVRPTVFFSVPKVYQSLVTYAHQDKEAEDIFFHSGLKFIFTAAAPLPQSLSTEFEARNIKVMEGWGLTETSPCCTLTDPDIKREAGVVGKPIAGVIIRIADDGEIQVKGPNVMKGYYKNDEANNAAFTDDGWYRTGDVGEITTGGLKLVSRKDRIFKLTNGEKVIPGEMEMLITSKCKYISFALVAGSGREYPVALLFPNNKLLDTPDYAQSPFEGCFCPRDLSELSKCLQGCLHDANCGLGQKFSKIKAAMLIDDELSLEKNTITPSMKMAPGNVLNMYKAHLEMLYDGRKSVDEEVYVIPLDTPGLVARKLEA